MARQNPRRSTANQVGSKAVRHKGRRETEAEALARIKDEMKREANETGATVLRKTNATTGQRIVLATQRSGAPVDEAAIGPITSLLDERHANRLFPPVTRRGFDWEAIGTFLSREFPKRSDEALAQRRIVEAIEQRTTWSFNIYDAKRIYCIECAEILAVPKNGINLCDEHRQWYKIPSLARALAADRPYVTLKQFNDERRKRGRAGWLRAEFVEAWEANNTREARRRIRETRSEMS